MQYLTDINYWFKLLVTDFKWHNRIVMGEAEKGVRVHPVGGPTAQSEFLGGDLWPQVTCIFCFQGTWCLGQD